jgi:hypothetical protein
MSYIVRIIGVQVKRGTLAEEGDWKEIKRIGILDIEKMLKCSG